MKARYVLVPLAIALIICLVAWILTFSLPTSEPTNEEPQRISREFRVFLEGQSTRSLVAGAYSNIYLYDFAINGDDVEAEIQWWKNNVTADWSTYNWWRTLGNCYVMLQVETNPATVIHIYEAARARQAN